MRGAEVRSFQHFCEACVSKHVLAAQVTSPHPHLGFEKANLPALDMPQVPRNHSKGALSAHSRKRAINLNH